MDDINKADIVTRMKWIDAGWEIWNPGEDKPTKNVGKWCHEAADEIERLRAALERKQRPEAETIDGVIRWIKEDSERLAFARAALEGKE